MSGIEEVYTTVRRELAATSGKQVLLVEGPGDVEFLTFLLDKPPLRQHNVHARWVFGAVSGKDSVLRLLEREHRWHGMVDRDAWDEKEISEVRRRVPNLHMLPRYCIENFLIEERALRSVVQRAREPRRLEPALASLGDALPQAIRHGSLWRAIQPLQEQLQDLGFNGALLKFHLPGDAQVLQTLRGWSELMDEERIFAAYRGYQAQGEAMGRQDAERMWVHGKLFWRHEVVPVLEEAFPTYNESALRKLVLRNMPMPDDLLTFLSQVLGCGETP